MTSIAALIFMKNAIAVDEDYLGPQFRSVLLEFLKEVQSWRELSESQKARNVLLFEHDIHEVFIDDFFGLDAVDD